MPTNDPLLPPPPPSEERAAVPALIMTYLAVTGPAFLAAGAVVYASKHMLYGRLGVSLAEIGISPAHVLYEFGGTLLIYMAAGVAVLLFLKAAFRAMSRASRFLARRAVGGTIKVTWIPDPDATQRDWLAGLRHLCEPRDSLEERRRQGVHQLALLTLAVLLSTLLSTSGRVLAAEGLHAAGVHDAYQQILEDRTKRVEVAEWGAEWRLVGAGETVVVLWDPATDVVRRLSLNDAPVDVAVNAVDE